MPLQPPHSEHVHFVRMAGNGATSVPTFRYVKEGAVDSVLIHEDSLDGHAGVAATDLHGVIGAHITVGRQRSLKVVKEGESRRGGEGGGGILVGMVSPRAPGGVTFRRERGFRHPRWQYLLRVLDFVGIWNRDFKIF